MGGASAPITTVQSLKNSQFDVNKRNFAARTPKAG